MNFSELTTRAAQVAHRADLTDQMVNFVADATETINIRFGLKLPIMTQPTDTNEILTSYPQMYLEGTLKSLYQHLNNGDNAMYYSSLFGDSMDQINITGDTPATDPEFNEIPPAINGGNGYAT